MAVQFAVTDLFRKNVVALALTKTSLSDMDKLMSGVRQDFYNHASDYVKAKNPDNRAIAGGHDPYFMMYEILKDMHPEWESYLWTSAEFRHLMFDLANPTKVFMAVPEGSHFTMKLVDQANGRDVTFLNGLDFAVFEDWWPTNAEVSSYTPRYSVMDHEDVLSGEGAGTYDFVEVHMAHLLGVDENLSDAYINLLKPGGRMVVVNSGAYKGMYLKRTMLHHEHYEPNMAFLKRDDLDVIHFPLDTGFTVITRHAS
tara:strand:- start:191 stop:955 length:765 start_codon:yes stop_codon:yes gene_type:complete